MADEQIIVDIKVDSKEVEIADDRIDKLTDSIEDLGTAIKATREQNKQYKKTLADLDKQLDEGTISVESHKKQTKLLNEEIKKNNIQIAKTSVELSKQKRERTANIKLITSETNVYDKLSARLNILRKNAKNVGAQFGTNSKQFKTAAAQVGKLDAKLKLIDNELGQNQRSVGKYTNALKGLGKQLIGSLGLVGGFTAVISIMKNAFKIFVEFQKTNSKLASVLGLTAKEINVLSNQQKKLGATTAFTASQVGELQIELAKLGFSLREIEASTPGILALAAATGTELAQAAEIAGATLRIFNLDASEMSRVTDVLALSTSKSSLSMEKLATILPTVGKTAQIAGVSLEKTVALAGTLTDRGLEASVAATSLRNIFLELSKKGITWNDAMKQINESTDKNKTSMDLFGKRAASAGVILSETADDTDKLTEALISADGAAQDMADTMLDNLAGDMTIAQSAWEGFILSIEDGEGVISKFIRSGVQQFTDFLGLLTTFNETNFVNRLKIMANSVLALINRFIPLVALYNTLTGSNVEFSFEIKNTSDALDENTESVKENEKEIKKETETTETAVEATKRLGAAKKKAAKIERENAKEKAKIAKQIAEDAKRVEAAEKKLIELDNQRRLSGIENAKQLRDERIKIEKETLKKSLENEKLFSIEKEALIQQSALNIAKINKEFNDDEVERAKVVNQTIQEINNEFAEAKKEQDIEDLEERAEFLQEFFGNITAMSAQFVGEEAIIFGNMASSIAKAFEDGKLSAEEAVEGIATITVSVFDLMTAKRNEDLAENEAARQKELELAEGNAQAQDRINLFYDKKNSELKRKQFNADKAKALIDIAISTAVGAAKALPNLILAGIVTGFGIAQGVLVATTKPPKFGDGTSDIVGIGDSHASGNDTDVWGFSGGQKQYFGKVEKGEAMPVIRKSAANDYMIAKLNGRFSSRGGKFADGTPDITEQNQAQNNEVFMNNLVDAFSNIQIVTKIEDITREARKKVEIVDNSKV